MRGGQRGDAHVNLPPGQPQADAAILRQALFGNVQTGHDLDARSHRRVQAAMRAGDVAQHTVAAQAHDGGGFIRFDVNVGGAFAHGLREQGVNHADDGRVVLGFQQVFDRRQVGHQLREVEVFVDVGENFGGVVAAAAVRFGQPCVKVGRRNAREFERFAQRAPHFGQRSGRGRAAQP